MRLASCAMAVATALLPIVTFAADAAPVSFAEQIRPIFAKHCVACHGGVRQLGGVSFIYREQALAEAESGLTPITPGSPEESYLLDRVTAPDDGSRMPPAEHGPALSDEEVALLRQWIVEGAEWEDHWAYVAPKRPASPDVNLADWPRGELDRFVLARLDAEGLFPAPEADRAAWLRRVALDLVGVPPSPEEYTEFELDNRPDAYERVVDRLLASPRFGERWASMWLDLARYADTLGYEKDGHRDAWPYRDWVIRAFNADMPFDEFTVKQLAGDLLPLASLADRVATAFHRNTQTNQEGGTDDEEFRTVAVLDRVATTWEAWQGTTMKCAQCHDHPYDPLRNAEYYQSAAFFNTSQDEDTDPDLPIAKTPVDEKDWVEASALDDRIGAIRRELFAQAAKAKEDESQWMPLAATSAEAIGQTKLVTRKADKEGDGDAGRTVSEVVAEGTITASEEFTLEFAVPAGVERMTALRIDVLPIDPVAARKSPEMGFVLSYLKGEIVVAGAGDADSSESRDADGGDEEQTGVRQIPFTAVYADEAEPIFEPEDSLTKDDLGWAEYTRMDRARHAVFVLEEPLELADGDAIRLVLHFKLNATGDAAQCFRRARFAVSESGAWTDFLADAAVRDLRSELADARSRRSAIPHVALPIMAELPAAFARDTFTFARGNWLDKEQEVEPGVPELLPPLPDGAKADRLAMARWLVAPENPLTARVTVNRFWQELFGVGLVETVDNFGSSGLPPSYPELLDYLAVRFQQDHKWSVKQLLREIVLSATYRQSSRATPASLAADPRNRLLSRGPRTRLAAEMIRDQALVLSGRLADKMYGPPVMPPQPDGVWRSVYNDAKWVTAEGPDRYRRAVYTYWKRTSGYPSMLSFDAPSRDICMGRRVVTNTPLQALVVMNDPAYVELAQGLAERMAQVEGDADEQIAAAYRWATGRRIPANKLDRLAALHESAGERFDADSDGSKALGPNREQYALSVVASAILNLDEVLTK